MPPTHPSLSDCPCLSLFVYLCLSLCFSISISTSLSLPASPPLPLSGSGDPQVGQETPPGRRRAWPREGCAGWSAGPTGAPGPHSAAARLSRAPLGRLSCGLFWALGFENILKTLGYPNNVSKALLFSAEKVERLLSEKEAWSQAVPSQGVDGARWQVPRVGSSNACLCHGAPEDASPHLSRSPPPGPSGPGYLVTQRHLSPLPKDRGGRDPQDPEQAVPQRPCGSTMPTSLPGARGPHPGAPPFPAAPRPAR